jgi:hypothetical protein
VLVFITVKFRKETGCGTARISLEDARDNEQQIDDIDRTSPVPRRPISPTRRHPPTLYSTPTGNTVATPNPWTPSSHSQHPAL